MTSDQFKYAKYLPKVEQDLCFLVAEILMMGEGPRYAHIADAEFLLAVVPDAECEGKYSLVGAYPFEADDDEIDAWAWEDLDHLDDMRQPVVKWLAGDRPATSQAVYDKLVKRFSQ